MSEPLYTEADIKNAIKMVLQEWAFHEHDWQDIDKEVSDRFDIFMDNPEEKEWSGFWEKNWDIEKKKYGL